MATIRVFIFILCFTFGRRHDELGRNFLDDNLKSKFTVKLKSRYYSCQSNEAIRQQKLLKIARAAIGIRELTGKNDGIEIAKYLNYVGLPQGQPYCAAFVSYIFYKAGYRMPRTAFCPDLFPITRQIKAPLPASIFGIYFPNLKRIAHVGFVDYEEHNWIITIEANTNISGGRDGNGNYSKRRHKKTISNYSYWIE